MCPSVALAPLHEFLSSGNRSERTHFLIGVHAFLYNRNNGVAADGVGTDVNAVQVTAGAGKEKAVVVAEPYGRLVVHASLTVTVWPVGE